MKIYLIVGMIDEGLSCHYILKGEDLLDAAVKGLIDESGYIMGWDFKDHLANKKIEFLIGPTGEIIVGKDIMKNFCINILEYMFESRVDGDSNAGYAIFDITDPINTKVIEEDELTKCTQ